MFQGSYNVDLELSPEKKLNEKGMFGAKWPLCWQNMSRHSLTCLPVVSSSIVSATADSLDYNLTAHFTDSTDAT